MAMRLGVVRLLYGSIGLVVLLLDRWTKNLVVDRIPLYESVPVIPGCFSLVHLQNPGAAFSMLARAPLPVRIGLLIGFSSLALIVVATILWRTCRNVQWTGIGLALVMGGAMGNLWDRILRHQVTDFLLVYYKSYEWPAFNVADSAISTGAVILVLTILFERRSPA